MGYLEKQNQYNRCVWRNSFQWLTEEKTGESHGGYLYMWSLICEYIGQLLHELKTAISSSIYNFFVIKDFQILSSIHQKNSVHLICDHIMKQ